eukprot:COSAG02_NODE_16080_length_1115_cov_0.857283_1_plen_266_part_00
MFLRGSATIVFDALQLGSLCNRTAPRKPQRDTLAAAVAVRVLAHTIWVAVDGDDANSGTTAVSPMRTVAAGLAATRALAPPKALVIGTGTYHLAAPLELTPADSGLVFEGRGQAVISGARALPANLSWTAAGGKVWSAQLPQSFVWPSNGLSGRELRISGRGQGGRRKETSARAHRARHPNGPPETTFYPRGWLATNTQGQNSLPNPAQSYWLPPTGCPGRSQHNCSTPEPCYWVRSKRRTQNEKGRKRFVFYQKSTDSVLSPRG